MKITVIAVGKIKERYFTGAIEEYAKRLSRFCRLDIVEVADEKTPDGAGAAQELKIREREGARILQKLPAGSYVIALAIDGKQPLSPEVLDRADERLSFSRMTFPHQLMRVILLEQIYRSYMIRSGAPYHK